MYAAVARKAGWQRGGYAGAASRVSRPHLPPGGRGSRRRGRPRLSLNLMRICLGAGRCKIVVPVEEGDWSVTGRVFPEPMANHAFPTQNRSAPSQLNTESFCALYRSGQPRLPNGYFQHDRSASLLALADRAPCAEARILGVLKGSPRGLQGVPKGYARGLQGVDSVRGRIS